MHINKDTQLCMSLASRPGNFGTRFHNYLYQQIGLNFIYKAFTTKDIDAAIGGIRAMGIRGCAISMPFKEICIPYLDTLDESAESIQSVNTILNLDGHLKGYNTDLIAVIELMRRFDIPIDTRVILRGSGGMARAVVCALKTLGFKNVVLISRNQSTGFSLAHKYGYQWKQELDTNEAEFLINVTPIGMTGGIEVNDLAFPLKLVQSAQFIFDAIALPPETPLIKLANSLNKNVITGTAITTMQSLEQFVLYTGHRPTQEQIVKASEYAVLTE